MKKIFEGYYNGIDEITKNRSAFTSKMTAFSNDNLSKSLRGAVNESANESLAISGSESNEKVLIDFDKEGLKYYFGDNPHRFPKPTIGKHPDFAVLNHNQYEMHYAVSMFVDIKGSTKLSGKYDLFQIRKIKDTLLTLCIHTANFFGGHIQRLQGDGIFIHFVRKTQYKNDAIINAINASSVLCHFVKTDLKEIFIRDGVKPLRIRVGIDFGNDDNVLWSYYGIPGCEELTTTSLHTDLAAKLQAQAPDNGILIGQNIKEELDLPEEFFENVYNRDGQIDKYIFDEGSIAYCKYIFRWDKYLKTFDFIKTQSNGTDLEIEEPQIRLQCKIMNGSNDLGDAYIQNSFSVEKGKTLQFEIFENGHLYVKKDFETITWKITNRGREASKDTEPQIISTHQNKISITSDAKYLGHHYMECTIQRQHSTNVKLKFAVFVR